MGLFCELNIDMAFYNAAPKPLNPGQSTHDYDHAAKLFLGTVGSPVDANTNLLPKQSFSYYVNINPNLDLFAALSNFGKGTQLNGMVKSVNLPKFTVDTKTMNAYNKKTIVQNKIQYDPITIVFYDDSANLVTKFWNDYYSYYYRDSDYESALYQVPSTYDLRQRSKWGYSIRNSGLRPFLQDIQVFSMSQKRFTEYQLINPIITAWRHGDLAAAESSGTLECSMTIQYEAVKYKEGWVNPVDVNGFGVLYYDTEPSPIAPNPYNVSSDQGIVGVLASGTHDLTTPDGMVPGLTGAGLINSYLAVQRAYQNLKTVNWGSIAQRTLAQMGINIVGGAINGAFNGLFVPTVNSYYGYGGTTGGITASGGTNLAGYLTGGSVGYGGSTYGTNSMYPSAYQSGYATSGGNLIDRATGAVVGRINQTVDSYFALQPGGTTVAIDSSGQPLTGTAMARVVDPTTGEVVTQYQVGTTAGGGYIAANESLNSVETRVYTAADGSQVTYRRYMNGDVMTVDGNNNVQISYANTTPSYGGTTTGSAYSSPYSGAVYAVNPFTGALSLLNGVANRVISTPINIATNLIDRAVTSATNTIITNVIDPITGAIGQAIDGLTGSIKNVFGFQDPGQNPYLVCSIDGTVQSTFDTSYGLTYATDFTGETIPIYQDTALNSYTGGGQFYD